MAGGPLAVVSCSRTARGELGLITDRVVGVALLVFAVCGGKRAGERMPAGAFVLNDRGSYLFVVGGIAVLGRFRGEDQTAAGGAGPGIGGHTRILPAGAGLRVTALRRGMNRLHKRIRREVDVSCCDGRSCGWNGCGRKILAAGMKADLARDCATSVARWSAGASRIEDCT